MTTEDFRLRDKSSSDTNIFLAQEEVHKIFPKNNFQCYIDFIRLRPRIGKTIPGEKIMLNAGISVCTARDNGMYNVVSICTFENKRDESKVDEGWPGNGGAGPWLTSREITICVRGDGPALPQIHWRSPCTFRPHEP